MILLIEAEMGKPPPPLSRKGKTLLALFWIAGLVTVAVSMYATLSGGPRSQGSAPAATEAR